MVLEKRRRKNKTYIQNGLCVFKTIGELRELRNAADDIGEQLILPPNLVAGTQF